ncbi:MAG: hypothetical protein ACYCOU_06990 [Sulfobacillus sp.]
MVEPLIASMLHSARPNTWAVVFDDQHDASSHPVFEAIALRHRQEP